MKAIVAERGQVTIPKPLREKLGLDPGSVLEFDARNGTLIARKIVDDPVARVRGCLRKSIDADKYLEQTRGPAK